MEIVGEITAHLNNNYIITYNDEAKTVSLNFTQDNNLSYTNRANSTEPFSISDAREEISPNVTYYPHGSSVILVLEMVVHLNHHL